MSNEDLFNAEQVSCCMDGEASDYVAKLGRSKKSRDCWFRFHLIQSAMRGDPVLLSTDFHNRVMQALENEPTVFAPRSVLPFRLSVEKQYIKPIAGLAIAATVAAVTVLGFQNFYSPEQGPVILSAQSGDATATQVDYASADHLVSSEAEMILAGDAIGNDLDSYLVGHMEQSTGGGSSQGMLPYVRLAGYDDGL